MDSVGNNDYLHLFPYLTSYSESGKIIKQYIYTEESKRNVLNRR